MKKKLCAALLSVCVALSLFSSCAEPDIPDVDYDEETEAETKATSTGKRYGDIIDLTPSDGKNTDTDGTTAEKAPSDSGLDGTDAPSDSNDPGTSTPGGNGNDTEPVGCKHDYKYTVTWEPTCAVNGYARNTCRICGYNEWVELPAHENHSYGSDNLCDYCGTYKGGNPEIEPAGCMHIFDFIAVEPPCIESYGLTVCALCGYVDEVFHITGAGHYIVEEPTVAPTCTSPGYSRSVCETCGFVAESSELPALGHFLIEEPALAPTCTSPGYEGRSVCETCGSVFGGREIPALGHYFVNNRCRICGVYKYNLDVVETTSAEEPEDTTDAPRYEITTAEEPEGMPAEPIYETTEAYPTHAKPEGMPAEPIYETTEADGDDYFFDETVVDPAYKFRSCTGMSVLPTLLGIICAAAVVLTKKKS